MNEFTPILNRDASHVINGYVYQVDLTIERWLNLESGQVLELECGEDIDTISPNILDKEAIRLLEQVKHRISPVTLRTPAAIESIVRAIEHKKANPQIKLLFRYTTNAEIERERPPIFEDKTPAIEMWEKIRTGQIPDNQIRATAIITLKTWLSNIPKPQRLGDTSWNVFRDVVYSSNTSELEALIQDFEWSTSCESSLDMQKKIEEHLINKGNANSKQEAETKYQRLFLYVFKVIRNPDVKRLTLDALEEQLALPTLSESDQKTLDDIKLILASLENRVSNLEQNMGRINGVVDKLAQDKGVSAAIGYGQLEPTIDPPPLVAHLSQRTETVKGLSQKLNNCSWLFLRGISGIGKTQLALLVAKSHGKCKVWIGLRDKKEPVAAAAYFDRSLEICSQVARQHNLESWYISVCEKFGVGSVVFLDDLPVLQGNDVFSTRLIWFVKSCISKGVKVLSTSKTAPPVNVNSAFHAGILENIEAPPFTEDETKEILEAYGATPEIAKGLSSFSVSLTRGHPALIVTLARYLSGLNFHISSYEEITGLFSYKFAGELQGETIRKLLGTVEDSDSRELLYRLKLATYIFNREDIKAIASVQPIIEKPFEKLETLEGLWIQKDTNQNYLVSPLIKALGTDDILLETRKSVNYVLGCQVLKKRKLNQWDAQNVVLYFILAEAYTNAAIVLIQSLSAIPNAPGKFDDAMLGLIWAEKPLPDEIDIGLQIYLRSLQIKINDRLERNTSFIVDDLERLIPYVNTKNCWSLYIVAICLVQCQGDIKKKFHLISRSIFYALKLLPGATLPDGSRMITNFPAPEKLLWLILPSILRPCDLISWVHNLQDLPSEILHKSFEGKEAEDGCMFISNSFWPEEGDKPKESQKWNDIISVFDEIEKVSSTLSLWLLWACSRRAKMIILAEYLDDFEEALRIANDTLAKRGGDTRIKFLMNSYIGSQYFYQKKYSQALPFFQKSLREKTDIYPIGWLRAMVNLSIIEADKDPKRSTSTLEKAVKVAKENNRIPETDIVRVLGELSIAKWLESNNIGEAFSAFDEAGERLLACEGNSIWWKAIFMSYGHTSGFFSHLVTTGEEIDKMHDGEKYAKPFRGMFYAPMEKERAALFNEKNTFLLLTQLAMFAEGVKRDDRAAYWAQRSLDIARTNKKPQALSVLASQLVPYLLKDDKYAETFDIALEASYWIIATKYLRQDGKSFLDTDLGLEKILGEKPNSRWNEAEQCFAILGLIPIAFRILFLSLSDANKAVHYSREVASLCNQIQSQSSLPEFWDLSSKLFFDLYSDSVSGEDLLARSDKLHEAGYNSLAAIAYMFITIKNNCSLEQKAYAQLASMPYISSVLKSDRSIYRLIIVPFLRDFWFEILEKAKFAFSNPQLVESDLKKTSDLPPEQQVREIFKVISRGLHLRLNEGVKSWLKLR